MFGSRATVRMLFAINTKTILDEPPLNLSRERYLDPNSWGGSNTPGGVLTCPMNLDPNTSLQFGLKSEKLRAIICTEKGFNIEV